MRTVKIILGMRGNKGVKENYRGVEFNYDTL
jgi:hypothetical protein